MILVSILTRKLKASILKLSWNFIVCVMLAHMVMSWSLLVLAGEEALTGNVWIYYYITTVSTVGYGDLSPTTTPGMLIVALFVIPGGVGIFASVIGKISILISTAINHRMRGMNDYSILKNHTVVIGWHGDITRSIIKILAEDDTTGETLLCVVKDMENPFPDDILFVRGERFSDLELLKRAGIPNASRVIIYDDCDEMTTIIAMAVNHIRNPNGHVVAYCDNPAAADMFKQLMPNIECTKSLSIEMLVRSATDAGIGAVISELLSVSTGATQYQVRLPPSLNGITYGELFQLMKNSHSATLLGAKTPGHSDTLNLPNDVELEVGTVIYYMATQRIMEDDLCPYTTSQ